MAECKGSSTKQLKQCLGFWDLMGASVGQIIGAGIMTLLGAAISMTGRFCTSSIFDRSCDHDMPVCTARIYSWHRPS